MALTAKRYNTIDTAEFFFTTHALFLNTFKKVKDPTFTKMLSCIDHFFHTQCIPFFLSLSKLSPATFTEQYTQILQHWARYDLKAFATATPNKLTQFYSLILECHLLHAKIYFHQQQRQKNFPSPIDPMFQEFQRRFSTLEKKIVTLKDEYKTLLTSTSTRNLQQLFFHEQALFQQQKHLVELREQLLVKKNKILAAQEQTISQHEEQITNLQMAYEEINSECQMAESHLQHFDSGHTKLQFKENFFELQAVLFKNYSRLRTLHKKNFLQAQHRLDTLFSQRIENFKIVNQSVIPTINIDNIYQQLDSTWKNIFEVSIQLTLQEQFPFAVKLQECLTEDILQDFKTKILHFQQNPCIDDKHLSFLREKIVYIPVERGQFIFQLYEQILKENVAALVERCNLRLTYLSLEYKKTMLSATPQTKNILLEEYRQKLFFSKNLLIPSENFSQYNNYQEAFQIHQQMVTNIFQPVQTLQKTYFTILMERFEFSAEEARILITLAAKESLPRIEDAQKKYLLHLNNLKIIQETLDNLNLLDEPMIEYAAPVNIEFCNVDVRTRTLLNICLKKSINTVFNLSPHELQRPFWQILLGLPSLQMNTGKWGMICKIIEWFFYTLSVIFILIKNVAKLFLELPCKLGENFFEYSLYTQQVSALHFVSYHLLGSIAAFMRAVFSPIHSFKESIGDHARPARIAVAFGLDKRVGQCLGGLLSAVISIVSGVTFILFMPGVIFSLGAHLVGAHVATTVISQVENLPLFSQTAALGSYFSTLTGVSAAPGLGVTTFGATMLTGKHTTKYLYENHVVPTCTAKFFRASNKNKKIRRELNPKYCVART